MSHAFPSEFSVTSATDKFIMYACLGKTCGATLAFLMHVNDFGYKLQSLYFFFLVTTEYEKKEGARAATVVVGVTIAAAANLNLFLFLSVLLYDGN